MASRLSQENLNRRALAIKNGKNTYVRTDGSTYTIRNRNNPRLRRRFGGQGGTDELSAARKSNRGGGTDGPRKRHERASTVPGTNRAAYGAAMAAANQAGMDGDHINDVARTSPRYKGKAMRRRLKIHSRFASVGSATGNHPNNIQPLTPDQNQRQKPADIRKLDNALKGMDERNPPKRQPKSGRITGPRATPNTVSIPRNWVPPVQDHVDAGVVEKEIYSGVTTQNALSRAVQMYVNAQPKFFQHPGSIPIYIP